MQFPNELIQLETLENARKLFGQRLRAAREAKNITQKELGALAKRAGNTIAMIERGEQAPEWDAMEAIFAKLGEPPAYYFSEERPPQPVAKPTKKEALSAAKEAIELAQKLGPALVARLSAALDNPEMPDVRSAIEDALSESKTIDKARAVLRKKNNESTDDSEESGGK